MNLFKKLLIVTLAVFFSTGFIFNFVLKSPVKNFSIALAKDSTILSGQEKINLNIQPVSFGLPVLLKIPVINIDAIIRPVGIAPDGTMGIPISPDDVAWFNLGPRPGEKGSAVIDGHSGWQNGIPAVFDNLYQLKIGDKIYVYDEKGVIYTFVVREIRIYDKEVDASEIFGFNDGKAHLNLITCAGDWNEEDKSHSSRLLIFADMEI